ncbi:hypothetical protein MNAN1_003575 [Malassezia nana]|uniref:Pseudouridine synthase RsuA/RluA-like domain-containing protein n=1 Tax=Malassezia nana TaxID=180528 RepID=A0AAF0EU95_9BASI|nr:hypothetical protein MNAN1_003575 [Malassezia nana]
MTDRVAGPGLRRLPPYWHEYKTRAKTRWYGRQIVEVFTTEFRDRTKEYYLWAIHQGLCTVNGHTVSPTYRIQNSDFLVNRVHRHEPAVTNTPVKILHRDDACGRLVVVKPGSIPVHATGRYHHHTLVEMVKQQTQIPQVYTSNRLDRLTSGIMVCSTTKEAACELGNDFNAGLVNKAYVCRVQGHFPDGIIDCREPILSVDRQSGLNIVHPKGKPCRTLFQRLSYDEATDSSVLVCRPITGRTHQIRVHAQFLGHPICNDPLYHHPVWATVDRDVLATAQPRFYERVGGGTGNTEVERVLTALKGTRDDTEGWARWRDQVLFGQLNHDLGYDDVHVPGANAETVAPPPSEAAAYLDQEVCNVCHTPLLPEPRPDELYIYLHAIKYWTDAWVFQDELPWWATPQWQQNEARLTPADVALPDWPLIAHHAGCDFLGLGKGGVLRRAHEQVPPVARLVAYPVQAGVVPRSEARSTMPPLALEVPRGLEDAAQREVLQRLAPVPGAGEGAAIQSALHSGLLRLCAPWNAAACDAFMRDALPVAMGAYWVMGEAVLPRDVLDALFAERVEALGTSGPGHEKEAQPTLSEQALLAWIAHVWDTHADERHAALDAWHKACASPLPQTWHVSMDRSSYVLPTLSTSTLEAHAQSLVAAWLGPSWTLAPRAEASLHVKLMWAPRFGVEESLQCGPRTRQGNPSGSLFLQLHIPAHAATSAEAIRTAMARARAHALCALLPIGDGVAVSALHSADQHLAHALDDMLRSRGRVPVHTGMLDAALVEMPPKPKDLPHAHLFDLYMTEIRCLVQGLREGARALVLTSEPRLLARALREQENEARREQRRCALVQEPLVWDMPLQRYEDARTAREGDEEARERNGLRTMLHHHLFVAQIAQRPLFVEHD